MIGRDPLGFPLDMLARSVISAVPFVVLALLGWTEAEPASTLRLSTKFGCPMLVVSFGPHGSREFADAGSHLVPTDASAPDDEVEIPDEPEDEEPDDLGDGIKPDDRPLPAIAVRDALTFGSSVVDATWRVHPLPADGRHTPGFSSLCRFLC